MSESSSQSSNKKMILLNEETRAEHIEFKNFDITDPSLLNRTTNRRRRTPLMIEFATEDTTVVDLRFLVEAGMNVAMFRGANYTDAEKIGMLSRLEDATSYYAEKLGVPHYPIATCLTLKTWCIMTGVLRHPVDHVWMTKGHEVVLTCSKNKISKCTKDLIFVDYPKLGVDLFVGAEITLGPQEVVLVCTRIINDVNILCEVQNAGPIRNFQTVCVRNLRHTIPFISEADRQVMKFVRENEIDMLIVYYIEEEKDIMEIKNYFKNDKVKPVIIGSLCTKRGLDNIDVILRACDGILFPRILLPYNLDKSTAWRTPSIQKWVAGKCAQAGKPMYLAGGFFDNVLRTGKFSLNEVSDATNAIMDGVTGCLFRECRSVHNTVLAIWGFNEICMFVEPIAFTKNEYFRLLYEPKVPVNAAEGAMIACVAAANLTNAKVIIVPTVTGKTAQVLLWLRPSCIVITVSARRRIMKQLYIFRNIVPIIYEGKKKMSYKERINARVDYAAHYAVAKYWLDPGDQYIALQRSSEGFPFCNMVKVNIINFNRQILIECEDEEEERKRREAEEEAKRKEEEERKEKERKEAEEEEAVVLGWDWGGELEGELKEAMEENEHTIEMEEEPVKM